MTSDGSDAMTLHHESHACASDAECTGAAMTRIEDLKVTIYEINFPVGSAY